MSKKFKLLLGTVFTAVMAFVAPLNAFAMRVQDDFLYEFDSTTSSGEEAGGIFVLFMFAFWCVFGLISILTTVILILSLIDIIKRENWKSENDKIIWLLLIIFIPIVSLYYYFFYRKTLDKAGTQGKVEAPVTPKVE